MRAIRLTLAMLVLACAATHAWCQGTIWTSADGKRVGLGVSIGKPLDVPPPTVVRGARPVANEEQRKQLTPRDLAPLSSKPVMPFLPEVDELAQPALATQPAVPAAPEKACQPTPIADQIIILDEGYARDPSLYVRGEVLLWWARGMRLPPLVTTDSPNSPQNTRAVPGFNSTRLLLGDNTVLGGMRPGARVTVGWVCDPCGLYGIEANFFFLTSKRDSASFDSAQFPVIGRPFFLLNLGIPAAELTSTPEANRGNLQVNVSTNLHGAELNGRALLWNECDFRLTGIAGFRYLSLQDRLRIEERATYIANVFAPNHNLIFAVGDRAFLFDEFQTRNRFFGGQIGAEAEWRRGRWNLEARAKLAIGCTHQSVDINGSQQITSPNGNVRNFTGGLYAVDSNIGHHTQTRFGFVPEVGLKAAYDINDNIRVFVGYDFLYWSSVLRAGDQIDPVIDANRVPNSGGPFTAVNQVRPRVPFTTTSFWAHGVSAGFELRY